MPQTIHHCTLENGLVLVAEPMGWVESAAFALLTPSGCQYEPANLPGIAGFTSEMAHRGCGERDSRRFVEDLENLGVERSSSVSVAHTTFGGAMLADKLPEVLGIYADLVQRPHLPEAEMEDTRLGCLQDIRSLEDNLPKRVMQRLRKLVYGDPFGRSSQGTAESVSAITRTQVANYLATSYVPNGAVLSVAGKFEWSALERCVRERFGAWKPRPLATIQESKSPAAYMHLPHDSVETHIGIGYPSVPYPHPDYFQARGAVGVLSDGMSSRLFTEIREKRSLCYEVWATNHTLKDRASVLCYVGTETEKAQYTLDTMLGELTRLAAGIQPDELARLKARFKSAIIMQQESSAARASAIASDWYYLGRVRMLEELNRILDSVTPDSINAYLRENPPRNFTVVTLGRNALELKHAVS